MIVWGGIDNSFNILNSGGRYDPATDTWVQPQVSPTRPPPESYTLLCGTGSEMIVWGGDRVTNSFQYRRAGIIPTQTVGHPLAPLMHRLGDTAHTAVWTGSEMIVWGGTDDTQRFEHRREIQSRDEHLGSDQHDQRSGCPSTSIQQSGPEGDDRLGWNNRRRRVVQHGREIQSGDKQLDAH